jgi:hypothetical protein
MTEKSVSTGAQGNSFVVDDESANDEHTHPWLIRKNVCFLSDGDGGDHKGFLSGGERGSLALAATRRFFAGLRDAFDSLGHVIEPKPGPSTDLLFVRAPFLAAVPWRRALFFVGRARHRLKHDAVVCTVVAAHCRAVEGVLRQIEDAASQSQKAPDEARRALSFDGLARTGPEVLLSQAERAGPLVALARVVQAQSKAIRSVLLAHDDDGRPLYCWLFDLVGAHPQINIYGSESGESVLSGYREIALRLVTATSARDVTNHTYLADRLPRELWERLETVDALVRASAELGRRGFFAAPVRITDLVKVPIVGRAVAEQYSEGCFATFEPAIGGQLVTGTGAHKSIHKGKITAHDLAVVVGVNPDLSGAVVWPLEGAPRVAPSSEAVELYAIDSVLPRIQSPEYGDVPVVRSKLHGHCGVVSFDPERVEYVPVAESYQRYPVSCGTDAQVRALMDAFANAESLRNPRDSRVVAFTTLPGHGSVFVEKWVPGKRPLQIFWEIFDDGGIVPDFARIPQGPFGYVRRGSSAEIVGA